MSLCQGNACVDCCTVRLGHALLALKMSRVDASLPTQHVMELGHHILKAHIYKSIGNSASRQQLTGAASSRDLQAYWLCLSTDCLSDALVSHRNLFSPNVKVCVACTEMLLNLVINVISLYHLFTCAAPVLTKQALFLVVYVCVFLFKRKLDNC